MSAFVGFAAGVLAERSGFVAVAEEAARPYWVEYVTPQLAELSRQATATCAQTPPGARVQTRFV